MDEIGSPGLGVVADTWHMSIEESDIGAAIRAAGPPHPPRPARRQQPARAGRRPLQLARDPRRARGHRVRRLAGHGMHAERSCARGPASRRRAAAPSAEHHGTARVAGAGGCRSAGPPRATPGSPGDRTSTASSRVTERAPLSRKLVRHRRVGDPQGRREGEGPAGRRPTGHLLRRGRARLRDAAVHRGCRGRGAARPRELPLHARRRAARAARGDRREDPARLRARGRPLADHRHERRQAGRLPGVPGRA